MSISITEDVKQAHDNTCASVHNVTCPRKQAQPAKRKIHFLFFASGCYDNVLDSKLYAMQGGPTKPRDPAELESLVFRRFCEVQDSGTGST